MQHMQKKTKTLLLHWHKSVINNIVLNFEFLLAIIICNDISWFKSFVKLSGSQQIWCWINSLPFTPSTHPITPPKNPLSEPEGSTMKWKIYIFLNHDKNYKTIWHLQGNILFNNHGKTRYIIVPGNILLPWAINPEVLTQISKLSIHYLISVG